jgi:SAM-dependent methyltransferase
VIERPCERFSDRVDDYVRGRPGYPDELYGALVATTGLAPGARVADLGSGTGLSSEPLVERGFEVYAVEPNEPMRRAAENRLGARPGFHSVAGSAEATGLAPASIDLAVAFQAFHWFDVARTRAELERILVPGGSVALVWNARRAGGTPFLEAYEALLLTFGTDYREVGHRGLPRERLAALFGGVFEHHRFDNHQDLDLPGLTARLLSSSYVPAADHPDRPPMLAALERIFHAHAADGHVRIAYDVDLFVGTLTRSRKRSR